MSAFAIHVCMVIIQTAVTENPLRVFFSTGQAMTKLFESLPQILQMLPVRSGCIISCDYLGRWNEKRTFAMEQSNLTVNVMKMKKKKKKKSPTLVYVIFLYFALFCMYFLTVNTDYVRGFITWGIYVPGFFP